MNFQENIDDNQALAILNAANVTGDVGTWITLLDYLKESLNESDIIRFLQKIPATIGDSSVSVLLTSFPVIQSETMSLNRNGV